MTGERAIDDLAHRLRLKRTQRVDPQPRQQRVVQFKRRILGGRADEGDSAVLDVRQERILLRFIETMHLVNEDRRGAACGAPLFGLLDRRADILHATQNR